MKLETAIEVVIQPALTLLPEKMRSDAAIQMLLTIGLQESRFLYRRQIQGRARGFFQFEENGLRGVLNHYASSPYASHVVIALQYPHDVHVLHEALADNDILAVCMARLLLWTDPHPLPQDADSGREYYLRLWRPGRPRPESWHDLWQQAVRIQELISQRRQS